MGAAPTAAPGLEASSLLLVACRLLVPTKGSCTEHMHHTKASESAILMVCATDSLGRTISATRDDPAKGPHSLSSYITPKMSGVGDSAKITSVPGRTDWRSVGLRNDPHQASGAAGSGSTRNLEVRMCTSRWGRQDWVCLGSL